MLHRLAERIRSQLNSWFPSAEVNEHELSALEERARRNNAEFLRVSADVLDKMQQRQRRGDGR